MLFMRALYTRYARKKCEKSLPTPVNLIAFMYMSKID